MCAMFLESAATLQV